MIHVIENIQIYNYIYINRLVVCCDDFVTSSSDQHQPV